MMSRQNNIGISFGKTNTLLWVPKKRKKNLRFTISQMNGLCMMSICVIIGRLFNFYNPLLYDRNKNWTQFSSTKYDIIFYRKFPFHTLIQAERSTINLFCFTPLFHKKNLLHTHFLHLQEKCTTKWIFKNDAGNRIWK